MKKFLVFLALLGGAAFSLLLNPSIKAKAANFWDSHIIIGGMNTTNGVPLKVDADGVVYTTGGSGATVSDTAYGESWDTITDVAPSKNAVYDKIQTLGSGNVTTSQATPQTIGDTTNRLTKLWATDITVTNAITGSVTGNAGTITNANDTTNATMYPLWSATQGGAYAAKTTSTLTYNPSTGLLSAGSFSTTASDGSNKILMSNNTSIAPTASSDEIYFEGNVFKVNENGTEKTVIDSASTVDALASSTSANIASLLSDESGTDKVAFTTSPVFTTPNIGVATATANIKGEPKHLRFTIVDPLVAQTKSATICIVPKLDAAITITNLEVTLDATTNEVAGDLKWADAFIGLANAAVIETFDTTSGVRSDASIASGAVAAGKCIYISFDSAPNTAIKIMNVDVTYTYN